MKKRICCILTACVMLMSAIMLAVPFSAEEADEPFKALEAIRISDTQIAVVFSEEVAESTLTGFNGYKGARYIWVRADGSYGGYIGDKYGENHQCGAQSVAFYQKDGTSYETILVYTYDKTSLDAFLSDDNENRNATSGTSKATPVWYIQEIERTTVTVDGETKNANYNSDIGHIYNFTSKSGKLLTATRKGFCNATKDDSGNITGYSTDWDDCGLPITTKYDWTPSVENDTTAAPEETDPTEDTTEASTENPDPVDPVDPDESKNPEETEKPDETEEPGESENPGESEEPSESEEPGETEEPEETEKPATGIPVNGPTSGNVIGNYVSGTESGIIYKVDITWGSMTFTYNAASKGNWNVTDHKYDDTAEAKWTWEDGANEITVTNHSNDGIIVTPAYTSGDDYKDATMTFNSATLTLATADNGTDNNAGEATTGTITVTPGGSVPEGTNGTIGQITLSIAGETSSEDTDA